MYSSPMTIPDSPRIDATDRSISPVMTISVSGSAMIATSPTFSRMKKTFPDVKKYWDALFP